MKNCRIEVELLTLIITMSESLQKTVCVVGLGYVGLPLAVRAKEKGYDVIGLDTNEHSVATINKKESPIEEKYLEDRMADFAPEATTDPSVISRADIVLVCVPTPVDKNYYPDLSPVVGACTSVAKYAKKGVLVVLESTVNPGVSEEIVRPIFEKAGHTVGEDVFLAHCPERINPGDEKWNVTNIPRVVGSFDKKGLDTAVLFYRSIIDAEIRPMKSIREAEAVKIMENSFRDVNLAFVNELAQSFDRLDIDIVDVIAGASTKPFAFMPHYPSRGVGGHCIPVDPYYLIEHAKKTGFDHRLLRTSRAINNSMPEYTVERLQDALNDVKLPLNGTAVGVLGIAYKENVDDMRETPTKKIVEHLHKHKAVVLTHDPHVLSESSEKDLDSLLEKSTALILATGHKEFLSISIDDLKKHDIKVVVDGVNKWDKNAFVGSGIVYRGIGH
ncbi:MAG: nucleotide sugar dehydrogenase [Candidatus Moranbacteria bacterium]|nr:nucleotide sugar dehydrogenase [Candidatus Moranbacteria bacterium]